VPRGDVVPARSAADGALRPDGVAVVAHLGQRPAGRPRSANAWMIRLSQQSPRGVRGCCPVMANAKCSRTGSGRGRLRARRRIPAAAWGLKKYRSGTGLICAPERSSRASPRQNTSAMRPEISSWLSTAAWLAVTHQSEVWDPARVETHKEYTG